MKLSTTKPHQFLKSSTLSVVKSLFGTADSFDVHEFRKTAFLPETPLHLTCWDEIGRKIQHSTIPAAHKWFINYGSEFSHHSSLLSSKYLSPHAAIILPYELVGPAHIPLIDLLQSVKQDANNEFSLRFHQFHAPLGLILRSYYPGLYIAQAQLTDLPMELQRDLPVPRIVLEAGRGDIYNANIWVGRPPTYTPLHKDPNPNIFVQLAGRKRVRLYEPHIGLDIFNNVQKVIGKSESAGGIRGIEMMEGRERSKLERAVWGVCSEYSFEGLEAVLQPGDTLFVPKGWWHSIIGLSEGLSGEVVASANWWFR